MGLFILVAVLAVVGLVAYVIAAMWKVFQKAGKPGWACIVPFYSGWTQAEIGGKPGWWGLLASLAGGSRIDMNSNDSLPRGLIAVLVPVGIVCFIFNVLINIGIAKNFGKSTAFGFLLLFLPFIGYPILAFGPAKYKKIV